MAAVMLIASSIALFLSIVCRIAAYGSEAAERVKVALCLLTKDQNEDLNEWLDYHKSIGVSNVILIDDNSTKPSLEAISDFVKTGFIMHYSYIVPDSHAKRGPQMLAYELCLNAYRSEFSHMGFIDTDEFIVLKNETESIIDLLYKYKDYGGLALNWMMIGSNGHITRPKGGVLSNYNDCVTNYHIKSIVNTKHAIKPVNPHYFEYEHSLHSHYYAVDTSFNKVETSFNPRVEARMAGAATPRELFETAYINHYVLKSREDFAKRRARGNAHSSGPGKDLSFWDKASKRINGACPYLKKRLDIHN